MILKNIPNALSVTRLILIAPILLFFYHQAYTYAFYTCMLAGITDCLDGWLARYFNWQSKFGRFIDPLADKLLITASFMALAWLGKLPYWLVILVFARDLTIALGVLAWYWLIRTEVNFCPTYLSKINTSLQLAVVTLCLFEQAFPLVSLNRLSAINHGLIFLTAITTMSSYIDYVWTWGKKAYLCSSTTK